jgi:hypothetical protein
MEAMEPDRSSKTKRWTMGMGALMRAPSLGEVDGSPAASPAANEMLTAS